MNFKQNLTKIFDCPVALDAYYEFVTSNAITIEVDYYTENHHILPVSLFPEFRLLKDNLVRLSAYNHFIAHYLLTKSTSGKMLYAFNMMNRVKEHLDVDQLKIAAELYSKTREAFALQVSIDAKSRAPISESTRVKLGEASIGSVVAKHIGCNVRYRVPLEEFHRNRHLYEHHMDNATHSDRTKRLMSENGIKGKHLFINKEAGKEVYLLPDEVDKSKHVQDTTRHAKRATERFTNLLHWYNKSTNESVRSVECPGVGFVQQRGPEWINPFQGVSIVVDIRTNTKCKIEKSLKTEFHLARNALVFYNSSDIYTTGFFKYLRKELKISDPGCQHIVKAIKTGTDIDTSYMTHLSNDLISHVCSIKVTKAVDFKDYNNQILNC